MSVNEAIAARVGGTQQDQIARLPDHLKLGRDGVHVGVLRRLASNRLFTRGGSAGILKGGVAARPFRLDLRQRVIVKAFVSRHAGRGVKALSRHVSYLSRSGVGQDGERGAFYGAKKDEVSGQAVTRGWTDDRHHFRFIISPEHGDRIPDLRAYVRSVMHRVAEDLREPNLNWLAVNHFDTDQPHAHVLVRGRREDGRDLVIPRAYVSYGVRARAQEAAQELLGDLTREAAERRVWRETQADRFTRFGRSPIEEAALCGGELPDGFGRPGSYGALLRGRLEHLEALGLASRHRGRVRLHPRLELELRTLQLRGDIIRTLNQRRLEGVDRIRELGDQPVRGKVVRRGFHDEMGTQGYAIVRASTGEEHYGRLRVGSQPPELGSRVQLVPQQNGTALVQMLGRSHSLQIE